MTAAATATFGPAWVEAELAAAEVSREDHAITRRGLLDRIAQRRADVRAAEADELDAVTEWADLHRTDATHDLLYRAVGLFPRPPRKTSLASVPVSSTAPLSATANLWKAPGAMFALILPAQPFARNRSS